MTGSDPRTVLDVITIVAAGGVLISALEYLYARRLFADDGFLSWRVFRTHFPWSAHGRWAPIVNAVMSYPRLQWALWARLIFAVLVIVGTLAGTPASLGLLGLLLTTAYLNLRSAFGLDGAYQMNIVILGTLFLASLVPDGGIAQLACLAFIAAQTTLSYLIAGFSKLSSAAWRDGSAMVGIFSTDIYGHPWVYSLLRRSRPLALVAGWSVIVFECAFPAVYLVPPEGVVVLLALGALFHCGTAVFMGLNGFVMAFVASYPALFFMAQLP